VLSAFGRPGEEIRREENEDVILDGFSLIRRASRRP